MLSERLVNECEALFFPARASEASASVGLLLAGLQSSTLLHRFSDWTAAWQEAGFAIAAYDFKDDRYTWGADAGVATFTALLAAARQTLDESGGRSSAAPRAAA